MMFQFYFRKMGSSESLKILSQKKLSDLLERFVDANGLVRITFQTERNAQRVLCHLQARNGQHYRASASSDNMYANLDAVAHKLEAQLRRVKTRDQRTKSRLPSARLRLISNASHPDMDFWDEDFESSIRHIH